MNCSQNTCMSAMNSMSCAFCAVGHKLFCGIHIVNLCEQPPPETLVKRSKASIGTGCATRLTGWDKLIKCLDEVAFCLVFMRLPGYWGFMINDLTISGCHVGCIGHNCLFCRLCRWFSYLKKWNWIEAIHKLMHSKCECVDNVTKGGPWVGKRDRLEKMHKQFIIKLARCVMKYNTILFYGK